LLNRQPAAQAATVSSTGSELRAQQATMSLFQGVVGAQIELSRLARPQDKLLRLGRISRIFLEEIVGTIRMAP
jgi:hypothetical protein